MAEVEGKKYGCESCVHFHDDSEIGDYGHVYYTHYMCTHRPNMGNLKQFPFDSAPQECFRLQFWESEFAEFVNGDDISAEKAMTDYREWLQRTYPQDYSESTESA